MGPHFNWHEMFDKVEFYCVDIRLLTELIYAVMLAVLPVCLLPQRGRNRWRTELLLYFLD
jgi:hypothetical protein